MRSLECQDEKFGFLRVRASRKLGRCLSKEVMWAEWTFRKDLARV